MSEPRVTTDQRPLSPHLTIYKPQITSVLSILHRITGAFLFLGALLFSWYIVLSVYGQAAFIEQIFTHIAGKCVLLAWTFSLYYHLLNGIRHLFWDVGYGFELTTVNTSGIAVVLGTLGLTAFTWYVAFYGLHSLIQ